MGGRGESAVLSIEQDVRMEPGRREQGAGPTEQPWKARKQLLLTPCGPG